ncbi:MAG: HAD family phosphatase [Pseudomonadota bacterium]
MPPHGERAAFPGGSWRIADRHVGFGKRAVNVVFDVGNVLLRWNPVDLVAEVLPDVDAPPVARQVFGQSHWQALDRGTLARTEAERAAQDLTGLGPRTIQRLFDAVPSALRPIEPMVTLLEALRERGVPTYVLSNMPAYIQEEIVREHGFFSDFHGRVFSNELELIKPETGIYEHLLDHHDLASGECLFIDDLPDNLAVADRLGFHTEHLPAGADGADCERVAAAVWGWLRTRGAG